MRDGEVGVGVLVHGIKEGRGCMDHMEPWSLTRNMYWKITTTSTVVSRKPEIDTFDANLHAQKWAWRAVDSLGTPAGCIAACNHQAYFTVGPAVCM